MARFELRLGKPASFSDSWLNEQSAPLSAGGLRVQLPSGPPSFDGASFQGTKRSVSTRTKTPAPSESPGQTARSVAANALGLGPSDRRCKSCRAAQFSEGGVGVMECFIADRLRR